MFVGMTFLTDAFLQPRNLFNVVRQISVVGLIAIGVTMVIITTGIDLSSGSVLALAAVFAASLAQQPDWHDAKYPGLVVPSDRPNCGRTGNWCIVWGDQWRPDRQISRSRLLLPRWA